MAPRDSRPRLVDDFGGATDVDPPRPDGKVIPLRKPRSVAQALAASRAIDLRSVPSAEDSIESKLTTPFVKQEWSDYKQLGLAPEPVKRGRAARLVVSSYRLLGFAILTLIVAVLIGYIAVTVFYFTSRSWVMPTVVSASDDKVVALQTQLAAQQNERDRLASELADAELQIAAEQDYQHELAQTIAGDLAARRDALGKVRALAYQAAATRAQIRQSNDAFATSSADRMSKEYDAGMIDRHDMLAGKYQLAQITGANLSLAERQAEFETRAAQLADEARSLDAMLSDKGTGALSYDILKIKRDYDDSKLAVAKAVENRDRVKASLLRQDSIIAGLQQSAYLRALADHAVVALVPYDNLGHVAKGTTLYGCKVSMVWCHEVGRVIDVLPGEIQFKHPHRDLEVRGQMIELQLTDASAGENAVLFAGGAPLYF